MKNIEKLIFYSKMILMLKLLKIKFNDCLTMIEELRVTIPGNERYFQDMLHSVDVQINIINSQIRIILQSLFSNKYFVGYNTGTFWGLTQRDLEKGYLKLTEGLKGDVYILLLSDTKHAKAGELVKVTKNHPTLKKILQNTTNLFNDLPEVNKSLLYKPLKLRIKHDN